MPRVVIGVVCSSLGNLASSLMHGAIHVKNDKNVVLSGLLKSLLSGSLAVLLLIVGCGSIEVCDIVNCDTLVFADEWFSNFLVDGHDGMDMDEDHDGADDDHDGTDDDHDGMDDDHDEMDMEDDHDGMDMEDDHDGMDM